MGYDNVQNVHSVEALQNALDVMQNAVHDGVVRIEYLEGQNQRLRDRYKGLLEENERIEQHCECQRQRLKELEVQYSTAKHAMNDWKSIALNEKQYESMRKEIAALKQERDLFRERWDAAEAKINEIQLHFDDDYEDILSECAVLREQVMLLSQEREDLRGENEQLAERIGDLEYDMNLERDIKDMDDESFDKLEDAYEALESENKKLMKQYDLLLDTCEEYRQMYEREVYRNDRVVL